MPEYHSRRVVCITVVPPYEQADYCISSDVETKVVRMVESLGANCRVSKFQWFVVTDEPCGSIIQDLSHEGIKNTFVLSFLVAKDWKFWCKPAGERDAWEFDGVAAFLQKLAD